MKQSGIAYFITFDMLNSFILLTYSNMGLSLKNIGLAAAFALGAGCNRGPSKEVCKDLLYDSEARPVEGACLGGEYETLNDFRRACSGEVMQKLVVCACDRFRGLVWKCVENESPAQPDAGAHPLPPNVL